jgi:hypothetical protein
MRVARNIWVLVILNDAQSWCSESGERAICRGRRVGDKTLRPSADPLWTFGKMWLKIFNVTKHEARNKTVRTDALVIHQHFPSTTPETQSCGTVQPSRDMKVSAPAIFSFLGFWKKETGGTDHHCMKPVHMP